MPLVGFLLRFCALGTHPLALFVCRVGYLVFHAPPEAVNAFGGLICWAWGKLIRYFVVVLFVIAVGRNNVVVRWNAVEAMYFGALFGGEAGHVLVVVIGMMPDGARWFDIRVDEELVVGFRVELSYPAVREWPSFVFHAPPRLWGNAIASV